MRWDNTQEEICKEVAEELGISVDRHKAIVEVYLKLNMRHIRQYEPVVVVNIGLFCLDARETNSKIVRVFKAFRQQKIDKEDLLKALGTYIPLHRLAKIHRPRWGQKYLAAQYNNTLDNYGIKKKKGQG